MRNTMTMNTKVDFQRVEKEKSSAGQSARLAMKQARIEESQARIAMAEQELLTKDTHKIMQRAAKVDTYEKCAKLGPIY